jgi:hypothetical protein
MGFLHAYHPSRLTPYALRLTPNVVLMHQALCVLLWSLSCFLFFFVQIQYSGQYG